MFATGSALEIGNQPTAEWLAGRHDYYSPGSRTVRHCRAWLTFRTGISSVTVRKPGPRTVDTVLITKITVEVAACNSRKCENFR